MSSNISHSSNQADDDHLVKTIKPSYTPTAIDNILKDLERFDTVPERLEHLENYLRKYKEDLSMVKCWKPTLPQYMLILVEALEIMKDSIVRTRVNGNGNGLDKILVDEFLAWKRRIYENEQMRMIGDSSSSSSSSTYLHIADQPYNGKIKEIDINRREEMPDYFPLESHENNNIPRNIKLNYRDSVTENSKTTNSTESTWKGNTRRTWTPELHEQFLNAMEKIGGPKVASPKQIREIMNVKGLTNDQIKSHLQKYRLHKRVVPARTNTVKINGSDHCDQPRVSSNDNKLSGLDEDCPNEVRRDRDRDHDHDRRRYQIPNLNTGLWDDHDDTYKNPQPNNNLSAVDVAKNAGGDDVSTSGPSYGDFLAWMSHYFKA